jgi:hypothetical protein
MISDILWGIAIGWTAIGSLTFMFESLFEGKITDTLIYDFRDWDEKTTGIALFIICVGVWPMVWLYEIFAN